MSEQLQKHEGTSSLFGAKLKILAKVTIHPSVELFALGGSMLDFEGDCCVNAANTGGITGFGIDELVNRAGGNDLKEARRLFNGIATGSARHTSSFNHKKVKYIIHAVGPVFRDNALRPDPIEVKYEQLKSAYASSMTCATNLNCQSIAFCLLSAGVFRGNVPLEKVIGIGVEGILSFYEKNSEDKELAKIPTKVCICAFTPEEQQALVKVMSQF